MKKHISIKTFFIGRFFIGCSLPDKRAMWITRTNKNKARMDHLISLHRTYHRDKKLYTYTLILFKLNIKLLVRG